MNLLIAPIDKNGIRKVGVKVIDANSGFIQIFKTFTWDSNDSDRVFAYFFHFCGELRNSLLGTEYNSIELTDGYDIQDKNIFIDYAHSPPKVTVEDKEGSPAELESGQKQLMYKKSDGTIWKYTVVKEVRRDEKYLDCIVIKGNKEEFRKFKVESIISETEL